MKIPRRYRFLALVTVALLAAGLARALAAVTLDYFRAEPGPDAIYLEWKTETELDTLGFYILRKTTGDGPWDSSFRLKDEFGGEVFRPAEGDPLVSHRYEWRDTTAQEGILYFYILQERDVNDQLILHLNFMASAIITPVLSPTPISTTSPSPTSSPSPTLPRTSTPTPTANPTLLVAGSGPTVTPPPPRPSATSPSGQPGNPLPGSTPAPSDTPLPTATRAIPPTVTQAPRASPTVVQPGPTGEVAPRSDTPVTELTPATPDASRSTAEAAPRPGTPVIELTPATPDTSRSTAEVAPRPGTPATELTRSMLHAPPSTAEVAPRPGTPATAATAPAGPEAGSGPPVLAILGGALALGVAALGLMRFLAPGR
jgi:hypothetical protein